MKYMAVLIVCSLALDRSSQAQDRTWAFPGRTAPDGEQLVNLRTLNEQTAGESGFVRCSDDGNDLVLGNGDPARFWAVSCGVSGDELPETARWLAGLGVNLVRICSSREASAMLNPKEPGSDMMQADPKAIDKAHRMVAELKKQGIYTMITPYWVAKGSDVTEWGIDGYTGKSGGTGLWGLLFFNENLQAAYRSWMKQLLTSENAYTGIPLAQDPAVGMILLQNEDSLLFWTVSKMAAPQQKLLGRKFAAWAAEQYGSVDAALTAWDGAAVNGDDPAAGVLAFYHVYEATLEQTGGKAARVKDQVRFFAETMRAFNEETERYLRDELGCRQLIIAENWKTADQRRLLDAERWAYAANEVIAKNHYFGGIHQGPRAGYRIDKGDLLYHRSVLKNPRALPVNMKHLDGHPHMVTESSWVNPNLYQSEGAFLVSAYMSLTGLDGYVWFACGPGYDNEMRTGPAKWAVAQPMLTGMFPAAALVYRRGYIREAEPVIREERSLTDVLAGHVPLICEESGFDPNRDEGSAERLSENGAADPLAFLVGPVRTRFSPEPGQGQRTDLSRFIDANTRTVRSATGEVALDYGRGVCTVDTPRAQGACGFLARAEKIALGDVTIACSNAYAAVLVVSLDGKPLAESRSVLVQFGTTARPTDWTTVPKTFTPKNAKEPVDGEQLTNPGRGPWRIEDTRIELAVANPVLQEALVMDPSGHVVRQVPVRRVHGSLLVTLPAECMYLVLR